VQSDLCGAVHGLISSNVTSQIDQFIRSRKIGKIFGGTPGFIVSRNPDTVRAPDVAFISQARLEETGIPEKYFPGVPDLAVEVVSPSDTVYGVDSKAREWLASGCRTVWVVQPRRRTVTVYKSTEDIQVLTSNGSIEGGAVLPGFSCPVEAFFQGWMSDGAAKQSRVAKSLMPRPGGAKSTRFRAMPTVFNTARGDAAPSELRQCGAPSPWAGAHGYKPTLLRSLLDRINQAVPVSRSREGVPACSDGRATESISLQCMRRVGSEDLQDRSRLGLWLRFF